MSKSNLYTRTGDAGQTSLVGGERVSKCCKRLEAYGTVDELSAHLGVISSTAECPKEIKDMVSAVQCMLFNAGGYLACNPSAQDSHGAAYWGVTEEALLEVESWIDCLDGGVPPLNAFVLPGGTPLAAAAHVARTVCRRAERRILELGCDEPVDPAVVKYVNRLSDWLFALARHFNHTAGVDEPVWHKG